MIEIMVEMVKMCIIKCKVIESFWELIVYIFSWLKIGLLLLSFKLMFVMS